MSKSFLRRFPAEGVLLDAGLLLSLWSTAVSAWTIDNYLTAFAIVGVLQALAVGPALDALMNKPPQLKETLADRILGAISPLAVLMGILAGGGFIWLFIPAGALEAAESGTVAWRIATVNFFVVLFGSLLIMGILSDRQQNHPLQRPSVRLGYAAVVFLYLTISEGLLRGAREVYGLELSLVLFGLGMAYLPIRFLLVWRPPLSLVEMGTAVIVFVFFVVSLF